MINDTKTTKTLKFLLSHYGLQNQKIKLIEEMSELIQAIAKSGYDEMTDDIISEMADVKIVLSQLELSLSDENKDHLNQMIDYKLKRQLNRIAADNYRICED